MPAAAKVRITDRTLNSIRPAPPGRRTNIWDAVLPNFGVRVTDRGRASFVVLADNKWTTLGQYPAMSLADARAKARGVLATPPPTERVPTFAEAAEEYIASEVRHHRAGGQTERVIRQKLIPALGRTRLDEVRRRDVVALVRKLATENGTEAARRAQQHLGAMMNWAVNLGDKGIEVNPAARLKVLRPSKARSRVLSEAELRAIWHAAGELGTPWRQLYRLLMLTGQRRGEVAGARWFEFSEDAATLTIPSERMKAGHAHVVPLTPAAMALVAELPRFPGGHYMVTTTGGRRPVGAFAQVKARLDALQGGTVAPWTVHDIRRTVRTGLSTLGVLPFTAELVIAHTQSGVHAVYDLHTYDKEKRAALELWEAELLRVVGDGAGEVVALRA